MYYMYINKNFVHQVGDQPRLFALLLSSFENYRVIFRRNLIVCHSCPCVSSVLLQLHDYIILFESTVALIKYNGFFLSWGDGERPQARCSVEYCASYDWSNRENYEGIRSEPSVAPRSPVGHKTTEGHTNDHCTRHSYSAGVNRFDFVEICPEQTIAT
jgi:hypothetical protein